jgi:ATP synthase protein I
VRLKTTRQEREEMRTLGDVLPLGIVFAVSIAIGYFAGAWVDGRFGVAPWGVLIGSLLGIGAAFAHLIQVATRISQREEEEARRRKKDQ